MAYKNRESYHELLIAKARVAKALESLGTAASATDSVQILMFACAKHFRQRLLHESSIDYFNRCAGGAPEPAPKYQGKIVEPFIVNLMTRPEWQPKPHLRAAEIDALPTQIGTASAGVEGGSSHLDL